MMLTNSYGCMTVVYGAFVHGIQFGLAWHGISKLVWYHGQKKILECIKNYEEVLKTLEAQGRENLEDEEKVGLRTNLTFVNCLTNSQ